MKKAINFCGAFIFGENAFPDGETVDTMLLPALCSAHKGQKCCFRLCAPRRKVKNAVSGFVLRAQRSKTVFPALCSAQKGQKCCFRLCAPRRKVKNAVSGFVLRAQRSKTVFPALRIIRHTVRDYFQLIFSGNSFKSGKNGSLPELPASHTPTPETSRFFTMPSAAETEHGFRRRRRNVSCSRRTTGFPCQKPSRKQ
jgi:hypothetical protein